VFLLRRRALATIGPQHGAHWAIGDLAVILLVSTERPGAAPVWPNRAVSTFRTSTDRLRPRTVYLQGFAVGFRAAQLAAERDTFRIGKAALDGAESDSSGTARRSLVSIPATTCQAQGSHPGRPASSRPSTSGSDGDAMRPRGASNRPIESIAATEQVAWPG
jgi:hypothetical protein